MPSAIPNGAMLLFTQHCVDVVKSRSSFPTIRVEGKTADQDDNLMFTAHTDGTVEVTDLGLQSIDGRGESSVSRWFGRALRVRVDAKDNTWHFKSVGGDIDVDLQLAEKGYDVDVQGTMDGRPIEYHRVVHAGVKEQGHIGDVAFHDNRWAQPHGALIEGALGNQAILEKLEDDPKPHPHILYNQFWKGQCGDVAVDEEVTHLAERTPVTP